MMEINRKLLLIPIVIGLLFVASCADDDEVAIDDPILTLASNSANANRGDQVTINGTITAAGGFSEITSNTTTGLNITQPQSGATDQQNWSATFNVPTDAALGSTISISFQASDDLGQESDELTFTITVSDVMDATAPTIAFVDFENEADTSFNQGAELTISFNVTKDDRIDFASIRVIENIEGDITSSLEDISAESGPMVDVQVTISDFQDNVRLSFSVLDELGNESDSVQINYEVLSPTGNTFLIDEFVVGSTTVQRVRGDIDEDVTLMSSNTYYISGEVNVEDEATLTIQSGTLIYAETGIESTLVIDDDGFINAVGTANQPIVMTSGGAIEGGAQEPGDWIGFRINGADGRNSGTVRYVRIEYGGDDGPEDAAFRLQQVDQSTSISFVQVFASEIAGVRFRGGDAHVSNLVVTESGEFSIDMREADDIGFTGSLQFVITINTDGSRGDQDLQVRNDSDPTLSNVTLLGPGEGTTEADSSASAVRLRGSTAGINMRNSIIAEYPNDGFRQDDTGDITDIDGDFVVGNSYIFRIGDDPTRDDEDPNMPLAYETDMSFMNTIDANTTLIPGITSESFVPNSEFTTNATDPTSLGEQFSSGQFIGAIGSTDWTQGWVLNPDGTLRADVF
ncbi:MAG: hypothetical protein AAF363_02940 [Bacteroidota bacterium]